MRERSLCLVKNLVQDSGKARWEAMEMSTECTNVTNNVKKGVRHHSINQSTFLQKRCQATLYSVTELTLGSVVLSERKAGSYGHLDV